MLRNLLIISIRNMGRDKIYSIINILGLTLGITCSLFLVFFALDELSYDKFHKNRESVYRVVTNITETDNQFTWAVAQIPFAPAVKQDYPEVTEYARLASSGRMMFKKEGNTFYEEDLVYADSATFQLLTFEFLNGDPETALYEPNSIVLTADLAIKYFGSPDVLGETLEGEEKSFRITGVIENIPKNSHLRDITGFMSYNSQEGFRREGHWGNFGVYTYIYTPELKDVREFEKKLDGVYDKYCASIFEDLGVIFKYELQNIQDIHLYSKTAGEAGTNGDIAYVYIFSAVAFLLLVIASINYMNLATARSMRRAREVGIRKVLGSSRSQIMLQFLSESMIFTIISIILSIVLVLALLPFFNDLVEKGISGQILLNPGILLSLLGIILFVGIISGSYPAFFLSSIRSVEVLKGSSSSKSGNPLFRKILVIFQFGISITMIISTWVVYDQLQFLREKDLGFNKDHIIRIGMFNEEMQSKVPVLKEALKRQPSVVSVGSASTSPGYGIGKNLINVENDEGVMVERGVDLYGIDYDYLTTLQFELIEGRNFSRDIPADTSRSVLVTESMAERMNWDKIIGKKFQFGIEEQDPELEVVGVVKDYHHRSLYDVIEPVLFYLRENNRVLHVRIEDEDMKRSLAEVESAWKEVFPARPFEYNFLDQEFDEQYKNDQRRGSVFTIFSVITIIIACLGLLGLASYTTEQRTREIGIRKVIGAGVGQIVYMISKDFLLLVFIAILISIPVAFYFVRGWLQNFAYRTDIQVITFLSASLLAVIISFLTISFHTIRAATANPVNSLRDE